MIVAHIRDNFAAAFYPRMSEWAAAAALFLIGWVLSANPELMSNTRTKAYDLMLIVASQEGWARGLIIFGGIRLVVLLVNGAIRRSPHLRAGMAFLSCFPLCLITLSFVPTFGIAMIFAGVVWWMDMFNVMRAASDARTIDFRIRAQRAGGGRQQQ